MSPNHSIDFCPICGGGLCGVRICGIDAQGSDAQGSDAQGSDAQGSDARFARTGSDAPHGLVICDECEAIWLDPDVTTVHQYPAIDDARCPICQEPLWGQQSRWADASDLRSLGWDGAVNPDLDAISDQGTT